MTLIGSGAYDRVGPGARTRLTGIRLRASTSVVASCAIRLVRTAARAGCRIADARIVALIRCRTNDGTRAHTGSGLTRIGLRTSIAVIACRSIDDIREHTRARRHVATIVRARIVVVARHAAAQGTTQRIRSNRVEWEIRDAGHGNGIDEPT